MTRSLNGLLSANSAVAKGYLREITDSTNQATAFAHLGTTWGVAATVSKALIQQQNREQLNVSYL